MLNRIRLLALLLGIQIVLCIVVLWEDAGVSSARVGQPLLAFDASTVDGIEISGDGQPLLIEKTAEGWRLPALDGFPADGARVERLLSRLQGLAAGHPVATSTEAAERFRVADPGFMRRLRLKQGDQLLAELYLGEASGVRRVHGRVTGRNQVHALEFALHEASDKAANWWHRGYLLQDVTSLRSIRVGDVSLMKQGDDWTLADLAEGESLDMAAVDELVRRVTGLGFQEVVTDSSRLQGEVLLRLGFETTEGPVEYRFLSAGEKADPLLTIAGKPNGLRIARFLFDELLKATRDGLIKRVAEPPVEIAPGE